MFFIKRKNTFLPLNNSKMNTFKPFNRVILIAILAISTFSCTTEDILPLLKLSVDKKTLSEDNKSIILTATLNAPTEKAISIPLILGGTASSSDYGLSASSISIPAGKSSGFVTINSQNTSIKEAKTIIVNVKESPNQFLVLPNTNVTIAISKESVGNLLINEVLYDPKSGIAGDANGDGTRHSNEDEFIEFLNDGAKLDISGYTISDATKLRHTFPNGTIVPKNGVIVVFGGGTPKGTFGGAIVQTASEGSLNMNNKGDFVTVRDKSGKTILTFDINPLDGNPNESYTRSPDLTGKFKLHSSIKEAKGALYSPGTKLDGSSF